MKKNLLCLAVLAASFAHGAMAQDFDDRWYLSGTAGMNLQDSARLTEKSPLEVGFGVGRFVDKAWSIEFAVYSTNPAFESNRNLNFSQYGGSVDLRRHFRGDANWWPYLKAGIGLQRSSEEFNAFPSPVSPGERKDNNLTLDFGAGLQTSYTNFDARLEAGVRTSLDDQSRVAPTNDYFSDPYLKASVIIPLGAKAAPATDSRFSSWSWNRHCVSQMVPLVAAIAGVVATRSQATARWGKRPPSPWTARAATWADDGGTWGCSNSDWSG